MKLQDYKKKKGFTLVELIVVLVILAILAALLIPALTGYIDNANKKKAIIEARQVIQAAQTITNQEYANGGVVSVPSRNSRLITSFIEIKKLAEVDGNIDVLYQANAKITYGHYTTTGGQIVIYDIDWKVNKRSGLYSFDDNLNDLQDTVFNQEWTSITDDNRPEGYTKDIPAGFIYKEFKDGKGNNYIICLADDSYGNASDLCEKIGSNKGIIYKEGTGGNLLRIEKDGSNYVLKNSFEKSNFFNYLKTVIDVGDNTQIDTITFNRDGSIKELKLK